MHRDPETGQFVSHDDEPVDLNYSDHEFINFRVYTNFNQGETGERGVEYQIETDVLDLENDELAMLTWLNASLSVDISRFQEFGGDVTRGAVHAIGEIGANLSGDEYIGQSSVNRGIDQIDDEADVDTGAAVANDEPGLWSHLTVSAQGGFKDADPDGAYSGNSVSDNDRMRRVYSEETGSGPYIDSTDDVNIGLYTNKNGIEGQVRVFIYGQMSFLVMEYEHRRQEFAPYDPGR